MDATQPRVDVSVVIPVRNEEDNLEPLMIELQQAFLLKTVGECTAKKE